MHESQCVAVGSEPALIEQGRVEEDLVEDVSELLDNGRPVRRTRIAAVVFERFDELFGFFARILL